MSQCNIIILIDLIKHIIIVILLNIFIASLLLASKLKKYFNLSAKSVIEFSFQCHYVDMLCCHTVTRFLLMRILIFKFENSVGTFYNTLQLYYEGLILSHWCIIMLSKCNNFSCHNVTFLSCHSVTIFFYSSQCSIWMYQFLISILQ